MSTGTRVRALIPTTTELVSVLLLNKESAEIGRSVVCIGGTTATAGIDRDYHAYVARPTGIIERLFGHRCYRLDVSHRIDAGSSWQLGALVAHALKAAGRLAEENDRSEAVIWATGQVRAIDLTVGAVDHVARKLELSLEPLRALAAAGQQITVAWPAANAGDVDASLRSVLTEMGARCLELQTVHPLFAALDLPPVDARADSGGQRMDAQSQHTLTNQLSSPQDPFAAWVGTDAAAFFAPVTRRWAKTDNGSRLALLGGVLLVAGLGGLLLDGGKRPDQASISLAPVAARKVASEHASAPGQGKQADNADLALTYEYAREGGVFHVRYRLGYLELVRKGGPVTGFKVDGPAFVMSLPTLQATVNNTTAKNLVLTAVVLDIQSSVVTKEVIPVVESGTQGALVISNQGWADVENAVVRFAITDPAQGAAATDVFPSVAELGTFGHARSLPLRKYVPDALRGAGSALVSGQLEYGPAAARRTLRFVTTVQLGVYPGKAMTAPDTYEAFYEAGKPGRTVVELQPPQLIEAGKADAFQIRLKTDKTSTTRLRVGFITNEGREIPADQFIIDAFVPRDSGNWRQTKAGDKP